MPAPIAAAAVPFLTKAGASTAATIAGAAISAVAAVQQGRAAANQAKAQATVGRQVAASQRDQAAADESDFRRNQSRLQASRRALLGATGVEVSSGSPLAVTGDFAAEAELQALRIRSGGETRATRIEQQAGLISASGRQARRAGLVRGGSLLLTGAGRAFA